MTSMHTVQVRRVSFQSDITTYWPGMQNTAFLVMDTFKGDRFENVVICMYLLSKTLMKLLVFNTFLSCKCNHIRCDQPPVKFTYLLTHPYLNCFVCAV